MVANRLVSNSHDYPPSLPVARWNFLHQMVGSGERPGFECLASFEANKSAVSLRLLQHHFFHFNIWAQAFNQKEMGGGWKRTNTGKEDIIFVESSSLGSYYLCHHVGKNKELSMKIWNQIRHCFLLNRPGDQGISVMLCPRICPAILNSVQ